MLQSLAKNPVFGANPQCLASFVQALVQPPAQDIPTPMQKPEAPVQAEQTENETPGAAEEQVSPAELEKRKQYSDYWSKFKRSRPDATIPSPAPAKETVTKTVVKDVEQDKETAHLMSLPTLVLGEGGEDIPASPLATFDGEPIMAEPVVPASHTVPNDSQLLSPVEVVEESQQQLDFEKELEKACDEFVNKCNVASPARPQVVEVIDSQEAPVMPAGSQDVEATKPVDGQGPTGVDSQVAVVEPKPIDIPTNQPKAGDAANLKPDQEETPATLPPSPVVVPSQSFSPEVPDRQYSPSPSSLSLKVEPPVESPALPPTQPVASGHEVAEVLKRVSTVDLENGQTPAPPQSLVVESNPPVTTVVMLDVGGVKQPVTVPLTPYQCAMAGLELAAPVVPQPQPAAPVVPQPQPAAPVVPQPEPDTNQGKNNSKETTEDNMEDDTQGEDNKMSSRQMLKNIYMRYSRSQKRFLKEISTYVLVNVLFIYQCLLYINGYI